MASTEYLETGCLAPHGILDQREIDCVLEEYRHCAVRHPEIGPDEAGPIKEYWPQIGKNKIWFKSLHLRLPSVRAVASNPALVDVLGTVLGPDVMLWGSQIIVKRAGERHDWHVDIETLAWNSVNVWIGLENTSRKAGISVITRTHLLQDRLEDYAQRVAVDRADGSAVLALAQKQDLKCELYNPLIGVGDAFVFNGRLWHGSINRSAKTRTAILLQYCSPECRVRIPTTFKTPIKWHPYQPPCLMVLGKSAGSPNLFI